MLLTFLPMIHGGKTLCQAKKIPLLLQQGGNAAYLFYSFSNQHRAFTLAGVTPLSSQ